MATPEKEAAVAELTEAFTNASAAVLTEYRGLTVSQLTTLRRALGEGSQYSVVKNTLSKIAAQGAGMPSLDHLLSGPTAIAFISGDPVEAAKALRDFAKANPALVVKGGVLDGKELSPTEITKLADLESRDVLLSKMAGALIASLSNAASLFQAPLAKAARAAGALQAKATEDPSIIGGAGEAAPADSAAPSDDTAAADTASGDPVVGETTDEPVAADEVPSMTTESKTDAEHPGEPASAADAPATADPAEPADAGEQA